MTLDDLLARPEIPDGSVTPAMIQRLVAGAADPGDAGRLRREIAADPELQSRFDGLLAEERSFESAHPWESVRDELYRRAAALPEVDVEGVVRGFQIAPIASGSSARPRWWLRLLPAMMGVAAVLGAFVVFAPDVPVDRVAPNRVKSAEGLHGFVLVEGRTQPLAPGESMAEGDRLQFEVSTTHGYLALLGVDGTGTVSRYFPVGADQSAPFGPGSARPLPDSLILDAAPGPEVFVAFLSDEPLPLDNLHAALHDLVDAGGDGSRSLLVTDWESLGLAPQIEVFHVEKRKAP
jgi:hypothetical protein